MTRISYRKLNKVIEERMYELFWLVFSKLNTRKDIRLFLGSLLSPLEQTMLAKRLAIALLLSRGQTYEMISEQVKVSTATVGGVHKAMLFGNSGYKRAVSLVKKEKQAEAFWMSIEEILLKLSMPQAVGTAGYLAKSAAGKRLFKHKLKRSSL
jgi:uncharacterized protein YerC